VGTINSLEADDLLQRNEPAFPWKSCITPTTSITSSSSSSLRSLPSFGAELVMSLTTYAAALSNLAYDTLRDPLAAHDRTRAVTTSAEDRRKVDKMAQAADMLCRASGVFEYVAQGVLPLWEARIADSTDSKAGFRMGKMGKGKMPGEFSRDVQRALAM
jgi:hypothetical protein